MSSNELIVMDNVRYCYGSVCAVHEVGFSADDQTLIALVGPNGGGKSTLIKLLSGLLHPDSGSIILNNGSTVAYVSQNINFDDAFPITVKELVLTGTLDKSIKLFARYSNQQKEKAKKAIDRVGLQGYQNRRVNQLSSGQLKRAVIARALATDADIIVLDEPDSSLDIDACKELYSILDGLKKDKTVIVASHKIDSILDIADSAIYINENALFFSDPMELKDKLRDGLVI